MGIASSLHDYCSLVLGTEDVSPLELASAYATLAAGGVHCRPLAITRITDPSGRVLYRGAPACRRVLNPGVAATATAILRGVVAPGGTGFRAAIGRPLAGKTGTTSSFADAWFTGFTRSSPPRCGSATRPASSPWRTCSTAGRSTAAPSRR